MSAKAKSQSKDGSAEALKRLPAIDRLVDSPELAEWNERLIRPVRVRIAQRLIGELRAKAQAGEDVPSPEVIARRLSERFAALAGNRMQKVINATGVVLHTNLGRAALGREWLSRMASELDGYCSLEFDLAKGDRGSRTGYLENLISLVCGVEGTTIVNNNAAATFLLLHTFAAGKEVIISRGQLVQIGGGYRVPDILAASGARLVEVGTTNMTSLADYEAAIGPETAMILQVHQSNFFISGHTEAPSSADLARLAAKKGVLFAIDLGSGLLHRTDWAPDEPTVEELIRQGVELLCFSGDKLLGGPQAGVLVGNRKLTERLRKSPLYRALRLGKTELYLLEQALLDYASGTTVPAWHMLEQTVDTMEKRSQLVADRLSREGVTCALERGTSSVGGGTMPAAELPSVLLALDPGAGDGEAIARRLRRLRPAVITRLEKKRLLLDLRTVLPEEEDALVTQLGRAVRGE